MREREVLECAVKDSFEEAIKIILAFFFFISLLYDPFFLLKVIFKQD